MLLVRVPPLSLKESSVIVLRCNRKEKEVIGKGVKLVELQIGQEIVTLHSPKSGIIEKILVPKGGSASENSVLAIIKDGLPVFDPEAEIELEKNFSVSREELTVASQLAIQQMLGNLCEFANRIQSLPPKWEANHEGGKEMEVGNGKLPHPLLEGGRKEEYRHPADIPEEHLDQAELRYNNEYQHQPSFNPKPSC